MLNQLQIIGRVGQEPSIKVMNNGGQVANLSIACSEKYKDKDGNKQEKTTWIPVVVFNEHLIKVIQNYVKKGDLLYISGAWSSRKWTDQNGIDKYMVECVLQRYRGELTMLGSKDTQNTGSGSQGGYDQSIGTNQGGGFGADMPSGGLDDEIPF